MIRLRHKLLIHAFRLFDQVVAAGCLYTIADLLPRWQGDGDLEWLFQQTYSIRDLAGVGLLATGSVVIYNQFVRYNANRFVTLSAQLFDLLKATTCLSVWVLVVAELFNLRRISTTDVVLFLASISAVGVGSRLAIRQILTWARRSGYNYRHLLIVGCNERAFKLAARIEASPELGYKIVGFVAERGDAAIPVEVRREHERWEIATQLPQLKSLLEEGTVDEMLVCLPVEERFQDVAQVIRLGQQLGVVVRLIPESDDVLLLKKLHIEFFEGDYVVTLFREQLLLQLFVKRLTDVVVSFVLLVLLSPLLVAVAIAIKLTSPGPVFFVQERMGMNKRRFRLYKFRSMVVDAERRRGEIANRNEMDGPVFKIKNDPRVTPVGRFIRKTSIDELPQLFNVLKGEMSLVGPRPPLPSEVRQYEWLFQRRLSIKPGLTCLWQVSGRNEVSFKQWMELDRQYIESWSLWLDFKILLRTIPVVLLGKGAS